MDAKALQDDLQSFGFTPSLAKPEIGKEVGRRRARSYDERVRVRATHRRGNKALERRSGIRENERQPVMA